jgi:hypothetical protein
MDESHCHINKLELLAALKALQGFTSATSNTSVEIKIDNTTAVSYINKLGGTRSQALCAVALRISEWCELRNLNLQAIFLPGIANFLADAESRRPLESGDWMLSQSAFNKIQAIWPMKVDLFASAWNARLPKFVSWLPQPGGWRTNALTIHWRDLKGYAFPPFSLIPHCLSKIIRDQASIVLVTPYWPS